MAAPLSVLPSALPAYPDPPAALAGLQAFRAGLHACCLRRADALVDLADALLSAQGPVASLPHLSLEPAHRRGWGSLYAALACGRIDAERLPAHHAAMVTWAMIAVMTRRLARPHRPPPIQTTAA